MKAGGKDKPRKVVQKSKSTKEEVGDGTALQNAVAEINAIVADFRNTLRKENEISNFYKEEILRWREQDSKKIGGQGLGGSTQTRKFSSNVDGKYNAPAAKEPLVRQQKVNFSTSHRPQITARTWAEAVKIINKATRYL